jgi:predicted dienelactone hydrolase
MVLSSILVNKMKKTAVIVSSLALLTAVLPSASAQFKLGRGMLSGGGQKNAFASAKISYQQWTDAKRSRTLPVKIYLPSSAVEARAPYPVVIFSHGLGGSVEAAPYLAEAWTKAGYFCLFVQHPGSDSEVWKPALMQGKNAMIGRLKGAANGENLIERVGDIKFVIDELTRRNQSEGELKGQLDLSKIAMTGHSLGAGTTLALAGQSYGQGYGNNSSAADPRIKAAIYLCPPVNVSRIVPGKTYAQIKIPGLLLTGTEDVSAIHETRAEDRRLPFDGISAPHQYLVNFKGANHATFGGSRGFRSGGAEDEKFHLLIAKVTTEFLDAALKNDTSAWQWLDGAPVKEFLGPSAFFERK